VINRLLVMHSERLASESQLGFPYMQVFRSLLRETSKAQSAAPSSKFVIAAYKVSTPHSSFFDSLHIELFEQPECDFEFFSNLLRQRRVWM